MAELIIAPTFGDSRGKLTVFDRQVPFDVKRTYFVYEVTSKRGGHRHHKTRQLLIATAGSIEVFVNNGVKTETFVLDSRDKCLLIEPEDWHTMDNFTENAVLLVFASEHYDVNDYIDEEYPND